MKHYVLVTGASSGIGEAACRHLSESGYAVLACVRKQEDGTRLVSSIGSTIYPVIMDVTEQESVAAAVSIVKEILGDDHLVGIVNNAGVVIAGAVLYVPISAWQNQFEVNVIGVVRVIQAFFHFLVRKDVAADPHPRRIINISSVSGLFAAPFIGPYASSKYALEAISDSLRRELYMYDVQVVLIEPGNIQTPIWQKAKEQDPHSGPEYDAITKFRDKVIEGNLSQSLSADVVAKRIVSCVKDRNVKLRYLIRAGAWKFRLISRVPDRWVDKMVRKRLKKASSIRPF